MGCCQNSILEGENPLANEKAILKVEANDIPSPFDGALQQSLDSSSISSENPNNQKLGFLKSLAEKSENSLPMKDFPISEAFANISQQQVLPVNFKQIVKPLSRFGEIAKNAVKEVKEREDIIDIERKLERGMTNAGKIIVDQADFVGDALKEGYEQSADLINSQVALIKEGLDDAMQAVKDLKIKKRLNDIVYPVLRKVFIHSVTCDIETKYNVLEIIGQGSLSTVKRVVEKLSGLERAAKIIVKSTLSDKQTESLVSEVETLKQLDHQNIVRVVEIVEEVSKLCIITELCAGGELFDRIMLCKGFDELMASKLMYQILSGLVHIHQNGFIHRDLKPENLLFMDKDSDTLKIIDFGITTDLTSLTRKKTSCVGSVILI
jgi:tRNA A-37 threonylcarbamoyl transferase component Bud32